MLLFVLALWMLAGSTLAKYPALKRLGARLVLLYTDESSPPLQLPVAAVPAEFIRDARVVYVDAGGDAGASRVVSNRHLAFLKARGVEGCSHLLFAPVIPHGARRVSIHFQGKSADVELGALPPQQWWPALVARVL